VFVSICCCWNYYPESITFQGTPYIVDISWVKVAGAWSWILATTWYSRSGVKTRARFTCEIYLRVMWLVLMLWHLLFRFCCFPCYIRTLCLCICPLLITVELMLLSHHVTEDCTGFVVLLHYHHKQQQNISHLVARSIFMRAGLSSSWSNYAVFPPASWNVFVQ